MHAELRKWRKAKGWTQQQAADCLRVPLRTYQNWEQGHRDVHNPGPVRKLMEQAEAE